MSQPHIKSCGFLVVRGKPIEHFLLMQHTDRWDLPKGHVDPGETEMQCALRELEEETGITGSDIHVDERFRFETTYLVKKPKRYGQGLFEKSLVIFLATLRREVPVQVTEHIGYRWFTWQPPHRIQTRTIDKLLDHVEKTQC